jgi:biotin carboxylase
VTASGKSTHEPELTELVMPFFREVKWSGAAEVELKRDARDGRFKVIEINPRFPGYLRLPQASGLDLPVLAVRAALGDEPAEGGGLPPYREGVTYVAPTSFFATVMGDAKEAGWMAAMRRARADARGAGPVVCSLLSDPWPVVTRSVVPEIRG